MFAVERHSFIFMDLRLSPNYYFDIKIRYNEELNWLHNFLKSYTYILHPDEILYTYSSEPIMYIMATHRLCACHH